jgi:serine/threonine protein kinase
VPLESDSVCTTFLAKTEGPASEPIVVKFVHHYNKEAHELLAAKGMAPKLRYCDQVGVRDGDPSYGDLCMVVMDFVDGETVDKAKTFPPMFVQRIQDILDVLHQADFVFGDLRGPNVMITKNDEVVFIDFDMVGKHGESRYPIMMSPCIKWAANVADGLHVMLKEHDLEMLERLVAKLSLSSI